MIFTIKIINFVISFRADRDERREVRESYL